MVPEKYRLAAVGSWLIQQFELRRPGLKAWTPEIEASLREQGEKEIQQMERQLREIGIDDPQYWQRVRGALSDILLPRYAKIATSEIEAEKNDYGLWRGGDLVARAAFAVGGFFLGVLCYEVPYIPIYVKWFPAVTMLAGPFLPEVQLWWHQRKLQGRIADLVADLGRASESLETYRPLSELTQSLGMSSELTEGPASSAEHVNGSDVPDRERS